MDDRLSFASLDFAAKKKRTKRDVSLAELAAVVPWDALEVRFTAYAPQATDPFHAPAVAAARRDEMLISLGVRDFEPHATDGLSAVARVSGSRNDVTIKYDVARDREPPRLRTDSVPPKGSRVGPGDKIVVTITARDDANLW